MILLALFLALQECPDAVEVRGFPVGQDPVFLVFLDFQSTAPLVALCGNSGLITGYAVFPGILNPPKTDASFDPETGILTVMSQYPFTANYFRADYLIAEGDSLLLVSCEHHDRYQELLDTMLYDLAEGDNRGVLETAWSVFYPGSNPLSRSMCVVLLVSGVSEAKALIDAGATTEEAVEWLEDVFDAGFNLAGEPLLQEVRRGFPEGLPFSLETFLASLEDLAELLDSSGNSGTAIEIREVIGDLWAH